MGTSARSDDALLEALAAHEDDFVSALESLWDVRPNHFAPTRVTFAREGDEIVEIDFKWMRLTDHAVPQLERVPALKRLNVHGADITDSGLESLVALEQLEELNLGRTQITNRGIESLKQLRQLRLLDVSATAINDEGIRQLSQIATLECLYLNFCREVSDWGIAPLLDLPNLRLLHVHGTRVTSIGAEDFAAAKPGCRVIR